MKTFHATNQTFAEAETEKKTFKLLDLVDFETNEHIKNSKAHVETSLLWLFVEHGNRLCQTC